MNMSNGHENEYKHKHNIFSFNPYMQELGLGKCQMTLIGVPGRVKGISGGELKRLAFASEVLTNPALLFADEPTSGLDSYMAQNIVEMLRSLASHGKSVVCTIHQPSSELFAMFDKVLLMAEGRLAFHGDGAGAYAFFAAAGFACPQMFNPADHYVRVLAIIKDKEAESRRHVDDICEAFWATDEGEKAHSHRKQHHDLPSQVGPCCQRSTG